MCDGNGVDGKTKDLGIMPIIYLLYIIPIIYVIYLYTVYAGFTLLVDGKLKDVGSVSSRRAEVLLCSLCEFTKVPIISASCGGTCLIEKGVITLGGLPPEAIKG